MMKRIFKRMNVYLFEDVFPELFNELMKLSPKMAVKHLLELAELGRLALLEDAKKRGN